MDNGSEFSAFSQVENWGCAVYFAHPYTSWERPQNERHNGLFRTFVPKGMPIEAFSAEYILAAADELNGRPRKKLGYRTPEELFDLLLTDYQDFELLRRTKGRREVTEADEKAVKELCQPYLDWRKEALK